MTPPTHALTIDTVQPGRMAALLEAAQREVHTPPAGRTLLGCWSAEFGRLNQLFRLWSTAPAGDGGCAALERPAVLRQREERLLVARRPVLTDLPGAWIYELRRYRLAHGRRDEFLDLLLDHFELRETWSKAVGLWVPLDGDLNEVLHLWPFRDLAHRAQVRAASGAHPVWEAYRQRVLPLLEQQDAALLAPVTFSPLR